MGLLEGCLWTHSLHVCGIIKQARDHLISFCKVLNHSHWHLKGLSAFEAEKPRVAKKNLEQTPQLWQGPRPRLAGAKGKYTRKRN